MCYDDVAIKCAVSVIPKRKAATCIQEFAFTAWRELNLTAAKNELKKKGFGGFRILEGRGVLH